MNRIPLAFRAFFNLLFSGELSAEILIALNLSRRSAVAPAKAGAPAPAAPTTKDCPFCCTPIPIAATRCPNCTSQLSSPEAARQ